MAIEQAVFGGWPGGAQVAVALTFDVDGEAPWLSEGPEYGRRLTMLSQGRFGPERGLARILDLLAARDVPATFYVPGHTADHHPEAITAILAGGHEIGHHGYLHRGTDGLDAAAQRQELEDGLAALGRHGVRPAGYRAPGLRMLGGEVRLPLWRKAVRDCSRDLPCTILRASHPIRTPEIGYNAQPYAPALDLMRPAQVVLSADPACRTEVEQAYRQRGAEVIWLDQASAVVLRVEADGTTQFTVNPAP